MIYKVIWTPESQKDLNYWRNLDKAKIEKIIALIKSIQINPKQGIGKPERLKYKDKNIWSRRIDTKHRLVYEIDKQEILVIQCRFHYHDH